MSLSRRNHDVKIGYWRLTFSMFELIVLPAPTWTNIQFSLGWFVVMLVLTTLAAFFAEPPYNFSPSTLGLMTLALLIGATFGSLWGGLFTDWLLLRLSKRQGGIYEPEHRLWAYLLMPFAGAGGVLLYGLGTDNSLHWIVPCLGLVQLGFYLNASAPVATGYALDSYPDMEDEIVQLSNFLIICGTHDLLVFVINPRLPDFRFGGNGSEQRPRRGTISSTIARCLAEIKRGEQFCESCSPTNQSKTKNIEASKPGRRVIVFSKLRFVLYDIFNATHELALRYFQAQKLLDFPPFIK
ncbi:hypothetical protein RJZ56_005034 [Blastomyces dermatitidis]|uniref:MFS transporter n=2 Tax=Ajellomyces dermatitidis TaxID=5039 RepID=F2TG76_AJEDA|nr:uncharacterized protein BDCG_06140 [Blastomyces dermatitidis ER-3]XP_045281555.1 hypothetical protein, variant [Blastomyces dermatitidis ER-3]EGE82239.1 hypothetical protein BDDG_05182 [Blastomyces dermatitidis ATCC 18188]OAT01827.1 hypothetical protein BDCG_06140 [Blastomyces dermatitidis ER-3]OAT01828.1 hypothetical protein, variant [Blastomyces dermatitidis ER-3]